MTSFSSVTLALPGVGSLGFLGVPWGSPYGMYTYGMYYVYLWYVLCIPMVCTMYTYGMYYVYLWYVYLFYNQFQTNFLD